MKLHWSPSRLPDWVLVVVALLSIAGFVLMEHSRKKVKVKDYEIKLEASQLTRKAFEEVRRYRDELNWPIDTLYDPLETGLIGHQYSPITVRRGELNEKILSTNPNVAAIVVDLFKKAGIKSGDTIGIGWNGSFPGLNIAVLAVCRTMKVTPLVISSGESSMWGANDSLMTWADIERLLSTIKILPSSTVWMTYGGEDDNGLGITAHGKEIITNAASRNGMDLKVFSSLDEDVKARIAAYGAVKAYVNIGYNSASYGPEGLRISPGAQRHPVWHSKPRSVLQHYMSEGIPVINLTPLNEVVSAYVDPQKFMEEPLPGKNEVFFETRYSMVITAAVVIIIGLIVFGLIRFDLLSYLLRQRGS